MLSVSSFWQKDSRARLSRQRQLPYNRETVDLNMPNFLAVLFPPAAATSCAVWSFCAVVNCDFSEENHLLESGWMNANHFRGAISV